VDAFRAGLSLLTDDGDASAVDEDAPRDAAGEA
jgi:hypothetical protein